MDDRIYDANDKAKEEGQVTNPSIVDVRSRIVYWSRLVGKPWNGKTCGGPAVTGYIDGGRWLAACECGNIEYVTAEDAIFFCHGCGNTAQGFQARPVIFPKDDERGKIEAALLERPIIVDEGSFVSQFGTQRAAAAQAEIAGLRREWRPGTTVKELSKQNEEAGI